MVKELAMRSRERRKPSHTFPLSVMATVVAAGVISVFLTWALLASLLVGTVEAFVDANADQGTVAAAAGHTIEALGRRDTADVRGGQHLMAGGLEDDGGVDGLAVPSDSAGRGAHFSSNGDGPLREPQHRRQGRSGCPDFRRLGHPRGPFMAHDR